MISPEKVKIGKTEKCSVSQEKTTTVEHYAYYIPFLPSLSKLLSCPDVVNVVSEGIKDDGEFLYDVCHGDLVKQHPLYLIDKNFLKFKLFCDDVEVVNPIGSHTKVHKLTVWYWSGRY